MPFSSCIAASADFHIPAPTCVQRLLPSFGSRFCQEGPTAAGIDTGACRLPPVLCQRTLSQVSQFEIASGSTANSLGRDFRELEPISIHLAHETGDFAAKLSIMTIKNAVWTSKAPKPLPGVYSQAIKANGMVFVSGAVPMDAETGKLIDGDIQAHTVSFDPTYSHPKNKIKLCPAWLGMG